MEATHRLLGHTAWLVLVVAAGGGAVALVRAGRGRQLTAAGPRRRRGRDRGRRDGAARLRRLAALAGVGDALPRGRRPAVPAARRRRSRRGARPRACSASSIVSILWVYDVWPTHEEQRPRRSRRRSAPASARATSSSRPSPSRCPVLHHYLPDGLRYATLIGYVKDVGVTDWRDGVERLEATLAAARPQADPRRAGARPPARPRARRSSSTWRAGAHRGPSSCGCARRSSAST